MYKTRLASDYTITEYSYDEIYSMYKAQGLDEENAHKQTKIAVRTIHTLNNRDRRLFKRARKHELLIDNMDNQDLGEVQKSDRKYTKLVNQVTDE